MKRALVAIGAIVGLFVLVQIIALSLVAPFDAAGYQAVPEGQTDDPVNSLVYVGGILVATGVMLAAFKLGVDELIRGLIALSAATISYYVFSVVLPVVEVAGVSAPAAVAALGLAAALLAYPEWYVIDAAGVIMGGGAAGLFGISFGVLPAIVLLTVLAVYDAISVYGTEHMLELASGVMDLKMPVLLVVPLSLSYSFRTSEGQDREEMTGEAATDGGAGEDGEPDADQTDRDAFFIGLGDAVMPTVLVASAAHFLSLPGVVAGVSLPALTAAAGTLIGLVVLMRFVVRGRAHAGLPLLNGGAIGGYLLGAVVAGVPLVEALGIASYL
jgi:presenilin-like A22 family membrane protease